MANVWGSYTVAKRLAKAIGAVDLQKRLSCESRLEFRMVIAIRHRKYKIRLIVSPVKSYRG